MAKTYVIIKNGIAVVERVNSKQEAELRTSELLEENPGASYESGKLDKRVWSTYSTSVRTVEEETYS